MSVLKLCKIGYSTFSRTAMARPREFDKEEVLEKAMRLFQRRGYEATSVQELTEATGLSRSSLYDTFGEKNALYLAVLNHYVERRGTAMRAAFSQPGSKKEAITAAFAGRLEAILADRERGCLAVDATTELALHDQEVARLMSRYMATSEEVLRGAIIEAQQQGEINPAKDPQVLALALVNALQGLRVVGKASGDRQMLNMIVQGTLSLLD